ncbi:phosphatase PAP2 family protein [bacterium]|nr:phosphatase PAP2 family protein [bacterium]
MTSSKAALGPEGSTGAFGTDLTRYPWLRHVRVCDWLFIAYMVATGVLILFSVDRLELWWAMLGGRILTIGIVLLAVRRAAETKHWAWRFVRDAYMPIIMAWLYVETGSLNSLIIHDPVDELLSHADEVIFGFQPAKQFYLAFPQAWLSEILNFCYFSYYFIFIGAFVLFWFRTSHRSQFSYQRYLFLTALVMVPCYAWYTMVPTWGPQYVWHELHSRDNFAGYIFKWALDYVLARGERPTGAFPSSHTALSAGFLVLLWRESRPWFWAALPTFIGLWFSTVYIQAHFAIDIIVGIPLGLAAGFAARPLQRRWTDPGLEQEILALPDDPLVKNPYPPPGQTAA